MLGALYRPKGLAYETASALFEKKNIHACNVAWGCTNKCVDCFIRYIKAGEIRYPKKAPKELVKKQLESNFKTEGIFISFNTDPLLYEKNWGNTYDLVLFLREKEIPVAVLSKMGVIPISGVKHGITVKALGKEFRRQWEPNALDIDVRIQALKNAHNQGDYTWISAEPYPCPAIHKQNDWEFWDAIRFVDFIIFGKWNYNALAKTEEAKKYYKAIIPRFIDFCKDYGIRYHIKSETKKFVK